MRLIDCRSPSGVSTCEGCHKGGGAQLPGKLRIFRFQELVRATNNFSERNILGKGSHSIVYRAVLNDGEVVAVKRPTSGRRTLQDAISFDNELEILSKLRHRHLVNLIGFCNEAREKLLVVEFMENGTLFDNLHSEVQPLSWPARILMALQAAKAIQALHSASPPIIHRDVKSSNILVDRNWNAKLSDLGLAVRGHLDDVTSQGNPPAGTMGYIDPEYQTPSQLSSKSDVFSFGILLLEIMSGRKAIDVRFNPASLMDWAVPLIKQGNALAVCDTALKPPQNVEAVQHLAAIAVRAVRQCKDRRPTMVEIVDVLRRIKEKLPSPLFGGNHPRVLRIAIPKDDIREGRLRANSSPAAVPSDEISEDSGDWVSFSKSEDERRVSGEGTSSPSNSEQSSNSSVSTRRALSYGVGQVPVAPTQAFPRAARVATGKPESPVYDPSSALTMAGSPLRVEFIRSLAGSPNSPLSGSPQMSGERSTARRSLESHIFGSQRPVRTMDAGTPVTPPRISTQGAFGTSPRFSPQGAFGTSPRFSPQDAFGASPRFSPQGANSRLKWKESSPLGNLLSQGRKTNNHSKRDVQLASQIFPPEGSSSHTGGMQSPIYSKPPQENGVATRVSRAGGSANGGSKVDSSGGSVSQPKVSFRLDALPIWAVPTPPVNFYSNAECHFEKVDLPIAV